jgi:hypothetical protein
MQTWHAGYAAFDIPRTRNFEHSHLANIAEYARKRGGREPRRSVISHDHDAA